MAVLFCRVKRTITFSCVCCSKNTSPVWTPWIPYLFICWPDFSLFFFLRRTFSLLLDCVPEFPIVPYHPCQAGPSLNGICVTSRHFSNRGSLSKPKTTLGSPLSSCGGTRYRGIRGHRNLTESATWVGTPPYNMKWSQQSSIGQK